MSDWDIQVAAAREDMLEDLAKAGFVIKSSKLVEGDIECGGRTVAVDITLPDGFPYQPPRVRAVLGDGGLSWHAERDGGLCLWSDQDSGSLPWTSAEQLVQRVQDWYAAEAACWPGDTPDLDLERYWPRVGGLVLYPDLDGLVGKIAQYVRNPPNFVVWNSVRRNRRRDGCLVLDVGELALPLRTAEQVMDIVDEQPDHAAMLRRGAVPLLLLRYWRQGNAGVLALRVTKADRPEFKAVTASHCGDATLQLRAGPDRDALSGKSVAVVGVGSIGSQVAELLARTGVGSLTLVDGDIVLPGNLIRHTAIGADIGRAKVESVRARIAAGPAQPIVRTVDSRLTTPTEAATLLEDHDVVVDATASGLASRLLMNGSVNLGRPVISVCLVREGQVARIDRTPLREGEKHAPAAPHAPPGDLLFEGGCGEPISPAPMWASTAAAALAAGAVTDLLTGRNEYPATVLQVLVEGDGACGSVGSAA